MTQRITEQMIKDTLRKLNSQMSFNITNSKCRYFSYNLIDNEIYLHLNENDDNLKREVSLYWAQKRFKNKRELYIYLLGLLDYETCVNCDLDRV